MISILHHRGPDGAGFYTDRRAGLAHARLSIIDLEGGGQPMHNEDRTVWITFNGEIFNYRELRDELERRGHRFASKSDTEVIIHLYEEHGTGCLEFLNGQFAFALWDRKKEYLFLARDRVGIRPLFYTVAGGALIFASEIKSLFMEPRVRREIDPAALGQIFTYWMTVPPRTVFKDIRELPAGCFLTLGTGGPEITRYWDPDFTENRNGRSEGEYAEELKALLIDSTRLQLRADVPVGAYLSGGIDSSAIAALVHTYTDAPLRTFSVTFEDDEFDESVHQKRMIEHLGADHTGIRCVAGDIAASFPDVLWHTETPVLRTAPAPLFLLSRLVRKSGYKVVLTGEGADEILAGYDIFKEMKVRRFLERDPGSAWRPLILKRLYPYLANSPVKSPRYAQAFFCAENTAYPAPYVSHVPRWSTTEKIQAFFSDDLKNSMPGRGAGELDAFLGGAAKRDDLSQAQYIEMKMLLSGYLLSSQGDRVAMAHSIEGRYPFLDHRVIEFCCSLPPTLRMRALVEKYLLKKSMSGLLPDSVLSRTKQPYRSPDAKSFLTGKAPEYVEDLLSERALARTGYFKPAAVTALVEKCRRNPSLGFKDNMAFVGIISTQLVHELFIESFSARETAFGMERTGAMCHASES